MPEFILPSVIVIAIVAVGCVALFAICRGLVRRATGTGRKSIGVGLMAAFVTVALVFVLTYLAAWAELRQQVATGDVIDEAQIMKHDFLQIRKSLSTFARDHGHYPDSLDELADYKELRFLDFWGRPYQYTKTKAGFRLFSLGRDGRPGGIGLDADIDSDSAASIRIEPTLPQFLFDAVGSRTLFCVASIASLCAGLACFVASGPPHETQIGGGRLLWSMTWTTVVSLGVSLLLVAVYLIGEHH